MDGIRGEGMIDPVVRTSGDGLERLGLGRAKRLLDFGQENSNTVAAAPFIDAAHSLLVPLVFWEEASPTLRTFSALYPIAMGATLVATAEHYVVDVGLGFALTLAAARGDQADGVIPLLPGVTAVEHATRNQLLWRSHRRVTGSARPGSACAVCGASE